MKALATVELMCFKIKGQRCGNILPRDTEPLEDSMRPQRNSTEQFWAKVDKDGPIPAFRPDLGPCWLWTAGIDEKGYGRFWINGRRWRAHRWAYEQKHGPIPEGLEPDHLCRIRACVRDNHIEVVTHRENAMRGTSFSSLNAVKESCPQGHLYDAANTKLYEGRRYCRACHRVLSREYAQRKAAKESSRKP
jgi:HNH endonuclease